MNYSHPSWCPPHCITPGNLTPEKSTIAIVVVNVVLGAGSAIAHYLISKKFFMKEVIDKICVSKLEDVRVEERKDETQTEEKEPEELPQRVKRQKKSVLPTPEE